MNKLKEYAPYVAWLVALMGMIGSLYFSNVLHFPPCVLCWWQRVFLYPLVVLIPVGILLKDKYMSVYSLILGGLGFVVGVYHNLLYYNILPEAAAPCVQGISCTTRFISWGGFITIPLLSLTAFAAVIICSVLALKGMKHEKRT